MSRSSYNRTIRMSSTVYFDGMESYRDAFKGKTTAGDQSVEGSENCYGIEGNPTLHELQTAIAELENADFTYLYPTGLSSIVNVVDALLKPGDHLLAPEEAYWPSRHYFDHILSERGITTSYYISSEIESLESKLTDKTKLIYLETPASNTFELLNLEAVVELAKKNKAVTVADATWSSGVLAKFLDVGIDISLIALTKFIGGYGDVFLGAVSVKEGPLNETLRFHHNATGAFASPFDAALALRGLESVEARIEKLASNGKELINAVKDLPIVSKIYSPDLNEGFEKHFSGTNGLFSIELDRVYDNGELDKLINTIKIFRLGESWGGTHSLILPYEPDDFSNRKGNKPNNTLLRINPGLKTHRVTGQRSSCRFNGYKCLV